MSLTDEDVREILRIIDESNLAELRLQTEGFSLHVVRGGWEGADTGLPVAEPAPGASPPQRLDGDPSPSTTTETQNHLFTIPAPMLGTFYRAEAPGKPPFVEVGSEVDADTIVCIIEVMKMMNSVPAGVSGTIAEILPENAELVEYAQPLFLVQPA